MPPRETMPGVREWETAQGWHVVELHYTADPEKRNPGWKEKTRRELGYTLTDWAREFEIDWTAGLGDCYFDKEIISSHYMPLAGAAFYHGYMDEDVNGDPAFFKGKGSVIVWRLPEHVTEGFGRRVFNNRYCLGADVAEGLEKGDFSAAYVLDRVRFEIVAAIHGRIPPDQFAKQLDLLGRFYGEPELGPYNAALLGVESNNHGHTVLNDLTRHLHYPRIYVQEVFNRGQKGGQKPQTRFGWFTSSKTKPIIIDNWEKALREKEIVIHDRALLGECLTFISKDGELGAQGSDHDDRVMAAAITLQMHKSMPTPWVDKPKETGWRSRLHRGKESAAWVGA